MPRAVQFTKLHYLTVSLDQYYQLVFSLGWRNCPWRGEMTCPAPTALGRKVNRVKYCEDPNLNLLVPLDHTTSLSVKPLAINCHLCKVVQPCLYVSLHPRDWVCLVGLRAKRTLETIQSNQLAGLLSFSRHCYPATILCRPVLGPRDTPANKSKTLVLLHLHSRERGDRHEQVNRLYR